MGNGAGGEVGFSVQAPYASRNRSIVVVSMKVWIDHMVIKKLR